MLTDGRIWGMGLGDFVTAVLVFLVIAALVKYVFSNEHRVLVHAGARMPIIGKGPARVLFLALSILAGLLPLPTAAFLHATTADSDSGRTLYVEHCAACHGASLEGAPDWQSRGPDGRFPAPPHDETGHTWHHGDAMLFDYTRRGGQAFLDDLGVAFDSGMPGFGDVLSDAEIEAILAFIRSTWPERIREFQATRTDAEGMD